jgi:hypothetical protein
MPLLTSLINHPTLIDWKLVQKQNKNKNLWKSEKY